MTPALLFRTACILAVACAIGSCTDPIAPAGATVTLSVAETVIPADGGTTVVSAFVAENDGYHVPDGTLVTFLSSGGQLCGDVEVNASCTWAPIVVLASKNGVAAARVKSGTGSQVTIDVKSGAATKSATITVSSIAAPADGKIYFAATPDTVHVGETAALTVYLTDNTGVPVPNATRVHLRTNAGALGRELLLTQGGFAAATFKPSEVGEVELVASSGALSKTIKIVVVQ